MIDQEKIKQAVRLLLEGIGEDPSREGLVETPERIARMYEEIYGGLTEDAGVHLAKTFTVEHSEMVLEKDITFYSTCEHHLLPFYGKLISPIFRTVGLSVSANWHGLWKFTREDRRSRSSLPGRSQMRWRNIWSQKGLW